MFIIYSIKMYIGYEPHGTRAYTLEFDFDTVAEFKQQFLKRFGNLSASNRVMRDKDRVVMLTKQIEHIEDILYWEKNVKVYSHWDIDIVFIHKNANGKRSEFYHIKNT